VPTSRALAHDEESSSEENAVAHDVLLVEEAAKLRRVCVETIRRAIIRGEVPGSLRIRACVRILAGEFLEARDDCLVALPRTLTAKELASFLRVHSDTVYAAVKNGEIDGVQWTGNALRLDRDRVIESIRCRAPGSRRRNAR